MQTKDIYSDLPDYPDKIGQKKKRPKTVALVFEGNCTGCEVCVPFCPVDCIQPQPHEAYPDRPIPPVQIRFDECIGCQICVKACSKLTWDAIRMVPSDDVEKSLQIKIGNTYDEAMNNEAAKNLDPTFVRKVANTQFNEFWKK